MKTMIKLCFIVLVLLSSVVLAKPPKQKAQPPAKPKKQFKPSIPFPLVCLPVASIGDMTWVGGGDSNSKAVVKVKYAVSITNGNSNGGSYVIQDWLYRWVITSPTTGEWVQVDQECYYYQEACGWSTNETFTVNTGFLGHGYYLLAFAISGPGNCQNPGNSLAINWGEFSQ